MRYMEVDGADIHSDIALIKRKLAEDGEFVFLYAGKGAIHDYIHSLHDGGNGLDDEELYKFRICYAGKNLNVKFLRDDKGFWQDITSMKCLIEALDIATSCYIDVSSDSREEFAFIVQQLIYIQYPLDKADVFLSQEFRDAENMNLRIQELAYKHNAYCKATEDMRQRVLLMKNDPSMAPSIMKLDANANLLVECCNKANACWEILLGENRDFKLAIAATKKTGKSVIVNSLIGQDLASTDVQLATPGNFVYRKRTDNKYHLWMEDDEHNQLFHKIYNSRLDLCKDAEGMCRWAQNDMNNGFALRDVSIGYPAYDGLFTSLTVYDTPGPDAAGTNHREAARRAVNECDAAVFCIDYSKYLTDSEEEYLKEIRDIFKARRKFHSLIFVLNKMDVRYADAKQSKSIAGAVDFIKTRLSQIADEYRDCIIFPISALEYFNAAEAERAGVTELNAPISANELKKLKFARRDVPELSWLHTHSLNLECYHGVAKFSYDVFKRDSGMPDLISYLTRVATVKSPIEIVNHVAAELEQQIQTFYDIVDSSGIFKGRDSYEAGRIKR